MHTSLPPASGRTPAGRIADNKLWGILLWENNIGCLDEGIYGRLDQGINEARFGGNFSISSGNKRHSRENGNPENAKKHWILSFAGMTIKNLKSYHIWWTHKKSGNTFFVIPAKAGHVVKLFALSSHFNIFWTPAFAGVTESGLFTRPSQLADLRIWRPIAVTKRDLSVVSIGVGI